MTFRLKSWGLPFITCAVCSIGTLATAPARAQESLASFGGASFKVDSGAVVGTYQQSGQGIAFGPRVSLGDGVGGTIPPTRMPGAGTGVGLIMRLTGTDPELPFTLETFDANFNITAKFQGQTAGLGSVASYVPLKLDSGSVQGTTIAGLQFTWDGDGSINIELLSLATATSPASAPSPAPEPSPSPSPPAPTLSPSPTPKPSPGLSPKPIPDRTRPSVKITSPGTVSGSTYTLAAKLADNVRPVRVQYRLRAPGAKVFGKWVSVNLRNKASTQNWSQPRIALNKRGVWLIQVQVFDAAKNSSLVPTLRVNRTR